MATLLDARLHKKSFNFVSTSIKNWLDAVKRNARLSLRFRLNSANSQEANVRFRVVSRARLRRQLQRGRFAERRPSVSVTFNASM